MNKQLSLLIDATTDITHIFLINENKVLDSFSKQNNKDLSYSLINYVEGLLKNSNGDFNSLKNIYLIYGPGKFSAMRIGLVVAKTICILKNIPLYVIDRFDYIASGDCLCVVASDGNKSFYCEYLNNKKISIPTLVDNNSLEEIIKANSNKQIIFDKNIHVDVISKLSRFALANDDFELEYYKEPC